MKSCDKMGNKHIGKIVLFYILMFASSFGGIIEQLLQNDYDYNYAMGYGLLVTFLNILIVSLVMIIVPFICRISKKELLPFKTGKRICLWNSIILFILSCVLMSFIDIGFIGGIGAVFFYFINKWIFVEPHSFSKEENKKEIIPFERENSVVENTQQPVDFDVDKMSPEEAAEYLVAEQLGEKYTPNVKQEPKIKIKYCSQCGSQIDPNTKKCTGCGKQYFKGIKLTKFSITAIALSTLLITSVIFNIIQTMKEKEISQQREFLLSSVDELVSENEDLRNELNKNKNLVDFIDTYVVFVENDGTNLYHKFGCYKFKGDEFWVYNTEKAEQFDYKPCQECH